VWLTKDIEGDVSSHSLMSVPTKRQINQITCIDNSNYFAVAGGQGAIDIYSIGRMAETQPAIIKTLEKKDEGDIMLCSNMILPISHQHVLSYVTQRGSVCIHDLRTRLDIHCETELIGS
jgi:hypothetical protein